MQHVSIWILFRDLETEEAIAEEKISVPFAHFFLYFQTVCLENFKCIDTT